MSLRLSKFAQNTCSVMLELPTLPRIYIIHVGSVTNKGTHALLKSEISELKKMFSDAKISISTMDTETLKRIEPTLPVYPPLIDIPYVRADLKAKAKGYGREPLKYKLDIVLHTFLMVLQFFLSMISIFLMKANLRGIYRSKTIEQFRDADIVISTSDESFKEGASNLPFNVTWMLTWWCMLFSRVWDLIVAKKMFRKPVIVFPSSAGPFRTFVGRLFGNIVFSNIDLLLLREKHSLKSLIDIKIRIPILITADTTLLFNFDRTRFHENLQKPVIGVSPGFYYRSLTRDKRQKYVSAHSRVLDYLVENYGFRVVFLPHNVTGFEYDDLKISEMILDGMRCKRKAKIICVETADEFKHFLGQLDVLLASKMHPAVLASTDYVPAVAVIYDHKQTGFFDQLGLVEYTIDINRVCYEELLFKLENILKHKEKIRKQLVSRVSCLQNDVRVKIREVILKFVTDCPL